MPYHSSSIQRILFVNMMSWVVTLLMPCNVQLCATQIMAQHSSEHRIVNSIQEIRMLIFHKERSVARLLPFRTAKNSYREVWGQAVTFPILMMRPIASSHPKEPSLLWRRHHPRKKVGVCCRFRSRRCLRMVRVLEGSQQDVLLQGRLLEWKTVHLGKEVSWRWKSG
jgi:hypothetical protein